MRRSTRPHRLRRRSLCRPRTIRSTWKMPLVYFQALKNAKVPAELHIYAEGGHGYGLRPTALPVTTWPAAVEAWMRTIKMLLRLRTET